MLKRNRPPVITVMGHIDHGKTTLLDALRKTKVQEKESGGITQHIGAYQIEYKGRPLTFIDTPGHAAFAAMRARGAQATDLVILVVDAIESIKPQTKECLEHIKLAKVPFLVAINKMDLPNASPAIVKKDLADAGVAVEGFGGDIVCVPVSAKTGLGLDQLLEMILLSVDMLELKSDDQADFSGIVIESSLDQKRGTTATIIVKTGTLKVSDPIFTKDAFGKVRALFNENNQNLIEVTPGQPALILGFKKVPAVGSIVTSREDMVPNSQMFKSSEPEKKKPKGVSSSEPSEDGEPEPVKQTLRIVLKADTKGTLEAIIQNLGDEITLISSGVGEVSESDVLLAQSTKAKIIAFRVKSATSAIGLADRESVLIKNYPLIHELLDDLQKEILKMLEPTIDEEELATANIIAEFTVKGSKIAGCEVITGKLIPGSKVHLIRKKQTIADGKIKSINQEKKTVDRAIKGEQCGVSFTTALDFQPKDKLVAYKNTL
ncbi:MAG: translation initiation factor IF-2 [Candidatus Beckwithbacteria bacterium]|nr:translation initiation factor IF-2 [Patescibacteria group bacterium]